MNPLRHDFNIIPKEFENDICFVCENPFKLHKPIELIHCLRRSKTSMEFPYDAQGGQKENNPFFSAKFLEHLLKDISKPGFTSNQSKVYIYLLMHGPNKAPEVAKALKLPRTEIYHILSTLQNMGIVGPTTFQHPIKFSALPIDKAIWILINAEKERINSLEGKEVRRLRKTKSGSGKKSASKKKKKKI